MLNDNLRMLHEIAVIGESNEYGKHRGGGKREQDSEESEQLPAGGNRKDDQNRVQPDSIADELRRKNRTLEQLCDRKCQDNTDERQQRIRLEHHGQ